MKKDLLLKISLIVGCLLLFFLVFRISINVNIGNNTKKEDEKQSVKIEEQNNSFYEGYTISRYPEVSERPICNIETSEKVVSFSFDDGYGHENIRKIVDIFKKHGNLKTTFFFCGNAIESDEKEAKTQNRINSVELVRNEGHEVANHSYSHPNFKKLSKEKMETEIETCNTKIEKITGKKPVLFRFPYGSYSKNAMNVVRELNMYPVGWNVDTLDWSKKSSCDSICSSICKGYNTKNVSYPHPGSIILMHTSGKYTPEALEIIIPILLKGGYKIVTVSDLILKKFETSAKTNMDASPSELISSVS